MMFPGWGMTGWVMAGYGLITVVLIAAVIALIASTATRAQRKNPTPGTAAEILAQRYARGEIDDDEYFRRLSVLDSTHLQIDG
jgi:putative membrane protein